MKNNIFENYIKNASRFLNEEDEDIEDILSLDGEEQLPEEPEEGDLDDSEEGEEEEPEMITCPDCDGEGTITDEDGEEVECETCGGTGEIPAEDQEYEFDPEEGVCPCCGAKLKCIGCGDEEGEEGEEELDFDPSLMDDEDGEEEDIEMPTEDEE